MKDVELSLRKPENILLLVAFLGLVAIGILLVDQALDDSGSAAPSPSQNTVSSAARLPAAQNPADIVRNPGDVPTKTTTSISLTARELPGQLADGTTYNYWTFDGEVPGPMLRVRTGDSITVSLTNAEENRAMHSIDLHAVNGPGGGADATQVAPGETKSFSFTALNPGLYVYHCATAPVPLHITNGMYGMILVEPPGGLPQVDREYYVMEGELYTAGEYGESGHQGVDTEKLRDETPEYYVFNGAVGALTDKYPLKANVGQNVRIFFGVGGPNAVSSFHVIGEIFDAVYTFASLASEPLRSVQTTTVPSGGATVVQFKVDVPGRYILVDHSLSRALRGLAGYLDVEGPPQPDIFNAN